MSSQFSEDEQPYALRRQSKCIHAQ